MDSIAEPLLPRLFSRLMQAMLTEEKSIPELDALPMAQLRLLLAVQDEEDAPMKYFSERLGITQSSITKLTDGLVKRGLIERIEDFNDRRMIRLRSTERARKINQDLLLRKTTLYEAIWNRLSSGEQKEVARTLERLCRVAEEIGPENGTPLPYAKEGRGRQGNDSLSGSPLCLPSMLNLMDRPVRGKALSSRS